MLTPRQVLSQISRLTSDFISTGLCDDQNVSRIIAGKEGIEDVSIGKIETTAFLKNIPYADMYNVLKEQRAYNLKMLDGALILMQYRFCKGNIMSHRLSFFPSPNLEEFQNEPELYLEDDIYADVLSKQIVTVPFRFDYDNQMGTAKPIEHPISHMTIGQYKNCRIPVTAAVTPYHFLTFILTHFYHTASLKFERKLTRYDECFSLSIFPQERELVHLFAPFNRT